MTVVPDCKAAAVVASKAHAFEANPHHSQLKPLLEISMQSKLERFNPDLHAGEMFAVEPIGQEFGAKFK